MTLIFISTCTNKKTSMGKISVKASNLPFGCQETVLKSWKTFLVNQIPKFKAKDLYKSRSAFEMVSLGLEMNAELYFISAGLGLIESNDICPKYDLTITSNKENSVSRKVTVGKFDPVKWWEGINSGNPHPISTLVSKKLDSIIICALSSPYYSMVKEDLEYIDPTDSNRFRLFGVSVRPESKISSMVVPYDNRFNGPDSPFPGTLADYPQRCAAHFVRSVLPNCKLGNDIKFVREYMDALQPPIRIDRRRGSDEEIIEIIEKRIGKGTISQAEILRYLRDDLLISCEQSRCSRLCKIARRRVSYGE